MRSFRKNVFICAAFGLLLTTSESMPAPAPALTVSISADPATIYAGRAAILTWRSQNAESVYIEPGIGWVGLEGSREIFPLKDTTYTAKARLKNKVASASVSVTVLQLPPQSIKADFTSNTQKSMAPLQVHFYDRSIASSDNGIESREWDFDGDGGTDSDARDPEFLYAAPGRYTVSLTVRDRFGNSDTMVKTDYILADADADADTIPDSEDNCPGLYNQTQVDLDRDGIGDACDDAIDLLHAAAQSLQLRKDSSDERSPVDVTAVLKDGILSSGPAVLSERKYDVLAFYSPVEASELTTVQLLIHATWQTGEGSKWAKIYAYQSDGISVQSGGFLTAELSSGWNTLDLSGLLASMGGFGFVKFRLAALEGSFSVSEAALTGSATRGLDDQEILAIPSAIAFGSIGAGGYTNQAMTLSNSGLGTLVIERIEPPAAPFKLVMEDCTGARIHGTDSTWGSASCTLTVGIAAGQEGDYNGALAIVSNDMDHRRLVVPLTVSVTAPAALSGVLTDKDTGQPIPNAAFTASLPLPFGDFNQSELIFSSLTEDGQERIWSPADYGLIRENDERKISLGKDARHQLVFRCPYPETDELHVSWNGAGGDGREYVLAQSFRAGKSGPLTKVSLKLKKGDSGDVYYGWVTAFLKTSYGGEKSSILSTSNKVSIRSLPDAQYAWIDVTFPSPYPVASGTTYFLEIATPARYTEFYLSSAWWAIAPAGSYRYGKGYVRKDGIWTETQDCFEFRTFVSDQLDQSPGSECGDCTGSKSQGLMTSSVYACTGSRAWSTCRDLARGNNEPGYDDLTLAGSIKTDLESYLVDDGWLKLLIYQSSYMDSPTYTLATDQIVIKPYVKYTATTAADGSFSIPGLPVTSGEIHVATAAYYPYSSTVVLTSGSTTHFAAAMTRAPLVDITIQEPVEGQVINSAHTTVRGSLSEPADVTVNGETPTVWGDARTNFWADIALVDGANTIAVVAVGAYGQISSRSVTVTANVTGTLSGSVLNYNSGAWTPVASSRVALTDASGVEKTGLTDETGGYEFTKVAAGAFTLTAWKEDCNPATIEDSIGSGQSKTLDIRFYPPPAVSQLKLNNPTISLGQQAIISWAVLNSTSVEILPQPGRVLPSGSAVVAPAATTTYTLNAAGLCGSATAQITLTVIQPAPAVEFRADPAAVVSGGTVRLTWSSTGAQACSLEPGPGPVPVNGFVDVTPLVTTTYVLTAANESASTTRSIVVEVIKNHPYAELAAAPCRIRSGEAATLSWISENVGSCTIQPDIGEVGLSGTRNVQPSATTQFILTCAGPAVAAQDRATVVVDDSYGDPTPEEQAHLEAINRARANPSAEAARLGIDLNEGPPGQPIGPDPVQPLRFSENLHLAAFDHTLDMVGRNYFSHTGSDGSTPQDRCAAEGYQGECAENLAALLSNAPLDAYETSLRLHDASFVDASSVERTRRIQILRPDFQEVGIGFAPESYSPAFPYGGIATVDFGAPAVPSPSLLGVVFDDSNGNFFYNAGEGIPNVLIKDLQSGAMVYTASAGGYSLPLWRGAHTIQCTLPDGRSLTRQVMIGYENVKLDITLEMLSHPAPAVRLSSLDQTIVAGESTQLQWEASNALAVAMDNGIGHVPAAGSMVISPSQTTTYTVTATGREGTATASCTVYVNSSSDFPKIRFTSNRPLIYAGESANLSWRIENCAGAELLPQAVPIACAGSTTVAPGATTTYTILAAGPGGSAPASLTVSVWDSPPILLQITEPVDGSTIDRSDAQVRGTFSNVTGNPTGIVVNGVAALLSGNQFVAYHVPLQTGQNRITATAIDNDGHHRSASVWITSDPESDHIRITATPDTGAVPFETTLKVEGSFPIPDSSVTYTGPGAAEFLQREEDEYTFRLTVPGIYQFNARVVQEGVTHADSIAVVAQDRNSLDAQLKSVFNGVKNALAAGEIETAAALFTMSSRERYRNAFQELSSELHLIAAEMQQIELIYVHDGVAKYRTCRPREINGQTMTITYTIYFRVDVDGIWRIAQL